MGSVQVSLAALGMQDAQIALGEYGNCVNYRARGIHVPRVPCRSVGIIPSTYGVVYIVVIVVRLKNGAAGSGKAMFGL